MMQLPLVLFLAVFQIAVLQAVHEATKQAHDKESVEMRENFRRIFEKLDSIEAVLRK